MAETGYRSRVAKKASKQVRPASTAAAKKKTSRTRSSPKSSASAGDAARIAHARRLADALEKLYPDAHCELDFKTPHELLVATILSAQATDVGVNKATPALFAKFPTPAAFAGATPEAIEPWIKSIGLYRNKAKAIHESMRAVVERFNGEIPRTMDELLTLRGVARKTANVVLSNAFGINVGFVVDTHVERLSKRFGLVDQAANVAKIERELMHLFPQDLWGKLSHQLIWHGRRACKARGSTCDSNPVCAQFGPQGPEGVTKASCEGERVVITLQGRPVTPGKHPGTSTNSRT
jgi:endonuclease-3